MAETQTSVKEVIPDVGGDFSLDENVISQLPPDSQVLHASSFGSSAWTRTARITVKLADGAEKAYFLKCATEGGGLMMRGEFESLSALYKLIPTFAPKPYAWGKLRIDQPETHFVLMDFLDLTQDLPDPVRFASRVAQLHRTSVSPTGKFGFHVPVCQGPVVQATEWDSSWCSYFTKLMKNAFEMDVRANGPWPEFEEVFHKLVEHAIPQILEPLQSHGRKIKPCLVHGDLWEENTGTNLENGEPVSFDAAVMYAHNEYEIGMWRRDVVRFGKPYIRQYLLLWPPSEPVGQWDDRNRLYSIRFNFNHTTSWPGSTLMRQQIFNDMCYLVDKYPPLPVSVEAPSTVVGSFIGRWTSKAWVPWILGKGRDTETPGTG